MKITSEGYIMYDYYIKDSKKRDKGLIFNLIILLIMVLMIIGFIYVDITSKNRQNKDAEVHTSSDVKKY